MKYAQTIHLSPEDIVEIIAKHLNIPSAQVMFKIELRASDNRGEPPTNVFTGADIRVKKEDSTSDLRPPPEVK